MGSTFYYVMELEIFSNIATLLGNTNDAKYYSGLAQNVRSIWDANFYNSTSHLYDMGYQTSQIEPLALGVVAPGNVEAVFQELVTLINQNGNKLDTGIVGTKFILPVLTAYNRTDLAYEVATSTQYPSWYNWNENGATTLWENWESSRFVAYGSLNHIMFGGQTPWYYWTLGGIKNTGIAWNTIEYKPDIANIELAYASASIQTHAGFVASSWQRVPALCSAVPENSNATLTCNAGVISSITFASFGTPNGQCGNFSINTDCDASDSVSIVSKNCVGKSSCSVPATDTVFGDPCFGTVKRLYIQVAGCAFPSFKYSITVPVNSLGDVFIPFGSAPLNSVTIYESGVTVWSNGKYIPGQPGIMSASNDGYGHIIFQVGSGSYNFEEIGF